ncbi:pyruvate kinase PKM-like isoform X2 [Physella acuta]|uniref:pyruvate kinase PKM-like isoform X2 n=1 Tax=Physella acuta TaxID=109671 RepID=UPI0027DABAB0|nr:pyruvate kinase PKM-like isoform X2 [Physella acuta]
MALMLAKLGPQGGGQHGSGQPGPARATMKSTAPATLPTAEQMKAYMAESFHCHNVVLDIDSKTSNCRLTHIVCTLGPASRELDMLPKLMKAGMNICRLNFSHGSYEYHGQTVQNIREAASRLPEGSVVAVALDTKGPEIRTGVLIGGDTSDVDLVTGAKITVTVNDEYKEKCSPEFLWVDYKNIISVLKEGSVIYIDDGLISLQVNEKGNDHLRCTILNGGKLGSKKGCNLPGTPIDLPAVSGKDKQDLLFGVDQNVDMVFASFIQDGAGIRQIRQILGEKGKHIKIIAKIESFEGIYNFAEILSECDGAMVARGDMGIEIPPEKVFIAQKYMISMCNLAGKPVICATQMLESMTYKPRATRAESNDVANAVLDGADCVMLSGESAKGHYPVEAVSHMAAVCLEAESVVNSRSIFRELRELTPRNVDSSHSLALAVVAASYQCMASAIIVLCETGRTVQLVSSYRPRCPIIMVTYNQRAAKHLLLYRAVVPHLMSPTGKSWPDDVNTRVKAGMDRGVSMGVIFLNDPVIVVMGLDVGKEESNCLQIVYSRQGQRRP